MNKELKLDEICIKMLSGFKYKVINHYFVIYKYVNKQLYYKTIYIFDIEDINTELKPYILDNIESLRKQIYYGIEIEKNIKLSKP